MSLSFWLSTQKNQSGSPYSYRTACHPLRIIVDLNDYSKLETPLILPYSVIDPPILRKLSLGNTYDYGMDVRDNTFQFNQSSCICPLPLVLAYTLAIATSGSARRLYMAGFDGYPSGDPRGSETCDCLIYIELYR